MGVNRSCRMEGRGSALSATSNCQPTSRCVATGRSHTLEGCLHRLAHFWLDDSSRIGDEVLCEGSGLRPLRL